MNTFPNLMNSQLILLVGAIAVVALVSRLVFQLFSQESKTVLALVAIVLLLQFGFGIGLKDLWFEINHLPQAIARLTQQMG